MQEGESPAVRAYRQSSVIFSAQRAWPQYCTNLFSIFAEVLRPPLIVFDNSDRHRLSSTNKDPVQVSVTVPGHIRSIGVAPGAVPEQYSAVVTKRKQAVV